MVEHAEGNNKLIQCDVPLGMITTTGRRTHNRYILPQLAHIKRRVPLLPIRRSRQSEHSGREHVGFSGNLEIILSELKISFDRGYQSSLPHEIRIGIWFEDFRLFGACQDAFSDPLGPEDVDCANAACAGVGADQGAVGSLEGAFAERFAVMNLQTSYVSYGRQYLAPRSSSALYGEASLNGLDLHIALTPVSELVYAQMPVGPALGGWNEMRDDFDISVIPRLPFALEHRK